MKKILLAIFSVLCLMTILFGCSAKEILPVSPNTNTIAESQVVFSDTLATEENDPFQKENEVSSNKNYLIQLCSFSDSIPGITHQVEFHDWREGSFVDKEAAQKVKLPVGGDDFQAEYWKTEKAFLEFYYTHTYWDKDRNTFSVTEDGQLSRYFFGKSKQADESGKIYSEAECREIAYAFLNNIVDADDYIVQSEYEAENKRYRVSFHKTVGGLDCADEANILVEENGHIYSFSSFMLGQIPTDATVDFDTKAIEAQLVERLDQIYADAKDVYDDIQYDFVYHTVTKDANGEYFLVSTVDIHCITDYGEVIGSIGERLSFVISDN